MCARPSPRSTRNFAGERRRIDLDAAVRTERAAKPRKQPAPTEPAPLPDEPIDPKSPWFIPESRFPRAGAMSARLKFCVRYAVLAPSSHNSQPWKFSVRADVVELWADRARALPVVDPHDRELTISCGAALMHLRLAMRHFFLDDHTELCPDRSKPDLLARVTAADRERPGSADEESMFRAIPYRRTTRHKFEADRRPPAALLSALTACAKAEGAGLTILEGDHQRRMFAKLVAEADEIQFASAPFRRELSLWMHHNRTSSRDGMPGFALGMKELSSLVAPLIVRTFDMGHGVAARDEQLALHSPILAVLYTPSDDEVHWLRAGQALAAVLLRAAFGGLAVSYLNQPLEIDLLRPRLARLAVIEGHHPQIVLRMGYAPLSRRTPRRPADEVLM